MKKTLLLFLMALSVQVGLHAQNRSVQGQVFSSEDGEGLPGVNVFVKGTTIGTVTDIDGKFGISVPSGQNELSFSFIGFVTKTVKLTASDFVELTMDPDTETLGEVIVVGYGAQSKRSVTGAISSVSGEKIVNAPVQSFDQALQGRVAGVNILTPNGVLNNPPVIRVRGVNSLSLSSYPLIVIDGVPTFSDSDGTGGGLSFNSAANNPLGNINPADILSVEVLKDAAAAAIYGSRASNGVILITTKRGEQGSSKVTFDSWVGRTEPVRLFDLLNAEEYMMIKNEARENAGQEKAFFPYLDNNNRPVDTNWYDVVLRNGIAHNQNLGISGGNTKTNYYFSTGYTRQEGIIQRNDFERINGRLNIDHKVFERFTVGATMNYTNAINRAPNTGSLPGQTFNTSGLGRLPLVSAPNVPVFLNDGSYNITPNNQLGPANNTVQSGFTNAAPILDLNRMSSVNNHLMGSVYGDVKLIEGLNFRTTYGIDRLSIEDQTFYSKIHGDGFSNGGQADNLFRSLNRWNLQNTLNYNTGLGELLDINFLVGNEQQYTQDERWGARRTVIADDFFDSYQGNFTTIIPLGNIQTENYLASFFARANFNMAGKYLLSMNARRDGFSAFAAGNKFGNFWGASAGYILSEESFWKNSALSSTLDYFRLRASYGLVGNNGVNNFASLGLYGTGLYGPDPTIIYTQPSNPNLTWETSKKTDFGINFSMLDNRIEGEVTWYNNLVDGLILPVPQAPSKGVPGSPGNMTGSGSIDTNIGSMMNRGIEMAVTYKAIQSRNFSWDINLNFSTLKNEVTALATEDSQILTATSLETVNITKVGHSVGSLYVVETRGVNPENGRRIFVKRGANGEETLVQYDHLGTGWTTLDGQPTSQPTQNADGIIMGPVLPTWFGGIDNTFRYGNFDLGVFVQFSGGNYIYNGTKAGLRDMRFWNNHKDVLDRWTPENPNGSIPRVVYTDNISNGSAFPISENVEKGDFIRVRNLMLGYTLPSNLTQRLKISNARLYGQVQNSFLFTRYSGSDPEISTNGNNPTAAGVDRNSIGQARTFTLGINIGI
ncbi:TonB-dependent receptor [Indibacter alkaliphilus LW1]|uniref:TonB-dependent receptor n=1 Tax=Indibacter alkaliphilus (strain CCUG 57479 / KCTC 22604 / LW1) TaxID=1189612 RepID=S2D1U1_INDAL|nr:TonB-dependent receptor [Indibacter alkaliphilus]EOZ92844.1 TonB-dependent receptor [Indibacter alkaliphilus LW1]